MSVYTPHLAPVVVLAFLGTAFLLILSILVGLVGILRNSRRIALRGIAACVSIVVAYGSVLLGLSLRSHDVELPPGAWKYFCEIDCHIAYAVGTVQVTSAPQEELVGRKRDNQIVIVVLKTWFDPATISAHRGNGPLTPSERKIRLIDGGGRQFAESRRSAALLAIEGRHTTPLRTPLRPGESYVSYLVFEIPAESQDFRLLVTSAEDLDSALWGHEVSPFHGKAYFEIRGTKSALRQFPATL
jgi:hypothetical protein